VLPLQTYNLRYIQRLNILEIAGQKGFVVITVSHGVPNYRSVYVIINQMFEAADRYNCYRGCERCGDFAIRGSDCQEEVSTLLIYTSK
jgi:hypothetical protein